MRTKLIAVTDDAGRLLLDEDQRQEPNPGSVVLVHGEFGTAWQRYFKDDKWHSVRGGRARTWDEMLEQRNMVIAYDAPERTEHDG